MRKKIVAGNWKMNKDLSEGLTLVKEIKAKLPETSHDTHVVLIPPYIHLSDIHTLLQSDNNISVGAQNCSEHLQGAYTGEISATMLQSVGVSYVILGHSERRTLYNETNQLIAQKISIALSQKLTPIFCCGEPLNERENNLHFKYIEKQLQEGVGHLSKDAITQIVIAYEPIWAIGTGINASPEQAQEMHAFIREYLTKNYTEDIANQISILYGGSCKPNNASAIFKGQDVDGGLIGGASLEADSFIEIISAL